MSDKGKREAKTTGTNVPNKTKAKKGKTQPRNEAKKGLSLPNWAFFTKNSVDFVQVAKALSTKLHDVYGPEVSISQFEKMIAEFPSLKEEEKASIYLDKEMLALLENYRSKKDAKDTERKLFRIDAPLKDITTGLVACMSALDKKPPAGDTSSSSSSGSH